MVGGEGKVKWTYGQHRHLVDALVLFVGLQHQILVDVLEVGDGDVLLELVVQSDQVLSKLNFAGEHVQRILLFYHGVFRV